MTCTVAAANSPVFSPSRVPSSFYKSSICCPKTPPPALLSPSPALLSLSPLKFRVCKELTGGSECSSSFQTLKRKRPAMLTVPVAPQLRFDVDSTNCVKGVDEIEAGGDEYSVYCKRGRRATMEDRYSAVIGLQGDSKQAFFGVFDGHGGAKAAEFAAKNMVKNIMDQVTRKGKEDINEAIKDGYLMTDTEFLKEDVSGGTCCLTALIREGNLVVSNAGDCRAVMSRGGVAEALTSDHRPSRKEEKERIETLGGYVDHCRGVWRIHGSLAVSRSIGDGHLKQWVTAEPETTVLEIKPEAEFLILASDRLWEKVSNQEAVDAIRPLCSAGDKHNLFLACKKLVDLSVKRGSIDDTSVMVIHLGQFLS